MEITTGYRSTLGPPENCRAFIPHVIRDIDSNQLSRFAHHHILLEHRWVFADEVEMVERALMRNMNAALIDYGGYDPVRDYVVTGGDPVLCSAFIFLVTLHLTTAPTLTNRITLLRWDKKHGSYFPFRLG